jgi:hypothetical protein
MPDILKVTSGKHEIRRRGVLKLKASEQTLGKAVTSYAENWKVLEHIFTLTPEQFTKNYTRFGNITVVYSSKTKPSLGQTNWFNTKMMRFTIQNFR